MTNATATLHIRNNFKGKHEDDATWMPVLAMLEVDGKVVSFYEATSIDHAVAQANEEYPEIEFRVPE